MRPHHPKGDIMGYKRTSTKPTVKETISNIMIERVEARRAAGENVVAPWRMTWDPSLGMPRNLLSGHAYRGINVFMTMFAGYSSPFWITPSLLKVLSAACTDTALRKNAKNSITFAFIFSARSYSSLGQKGLSQ